VFDDIVNELAPKLEQADGLVVGSADNALCNDAGPISAFGRHPASTQSRFSALRHPFAMMRAEIRKNPRSVAVLRAL
jgi:hypothetical protein